MRSRHCPSADHSVRAEARGTHELDLRRALRIPELTDVEVLGFAVDGFDPLPAEHDVGGCLHHPLARNDSFSVLLETTLAQEGLEHRGLRLLELQEQWVAVVAS